VLGYLHSKRLDSILDCNATQLHQIIRLVEVDLDKFSINGFILNREGLKVALLGLHIQDVLDVCLEQAHFLLLLLES